MVFIITIQIKRNYLNETVVSIVRTESYWKRESMKLGDAIVIKVLISNKLFYYDYCPWIVLIVLLNS